MSKNVVSGGAELGFFTRLFLAFSNSVTQPAQRRRLLVPALTLLIPGLAILSACSGGKNVTGVKMSPRVVAPGQPIPKGGGRYKIGSPYKILGQWFHPREDWRYDKTGTASWYGEMFHARRTANGEVYDMNALTAAHPTLPLPVYAKVTNLKNGRSIVVRINDRGPYKHNRIIDMSRHSATLLGFKRQGTAPVRVQFLKKAPLNGNTRYERGYLAMQNQKNRRWSSLKADNMSVGAIPRSHPTSHKVSKSDFASDFARKKASAPLRTNIFIQAGVFRNSGNAERFKKRLARLGKVNIEPQATKGGIIHRVTLGPYFEDESADIALTSVVRAGVIDARIIRK